MSEEQNDSPAFRLRPRRSAPKSYYAVRLEYSANPAAFIRERPRTSSKRKVFSQKPQASNQTRVNQTGQSCSQLASLTKEEQDRDERRRLLRRNIADSITTGTLVSPFLQRLDLGELEPSSTYEHNYVTLMIKQVNAVSLIQPNTGKVLSCLCQDVDTNLTDKPGKSVKVEMYDEYADSSLVRSGKMISIAKFSTSPVRRDGDIQSFVNTDTTTSTTTAAADDDDLKPTTNPTLPFTVIVRFDEHSVEQQQLLQHHHHQQATRSRSNSTNRSSSQSTASGSTTNNNSTSTTNNNNYNNSNQTDKSPERGQPLVPFISITEMIEQPIDPYVEMMPSPNANNGGNGVVATSKYGNRDDHHNQIDDGVHGGDENHDTKKLKFTANPPI